MLTYYQCHCSQLQQVSKALCEAVGLLLGMHGRIKANALHEYC
jgi:hypothetical protein